CGMLAFGSLLIVYPLFVRFPVFFHEVLTVRGIPLIHFKGDLAGTFVAAGAVFFFLGFEHSGNKWQAVVSLLLVGLVLTTNNRASMLALACTVALLAAGGRWKFGAVLTTAALAAVAATLTFAAVRGETWRETPLHG